jgi:hypothetical protein
MAAAICYVYICVCDCVYVRTSECSSGSGSLVGVAPRVYTGSFSTWINNRRNHNGKIFIRDGSYIGRNYSRPVIASGFTADGFLQERDLGGNGKQKRTSLLEEEDRIKRGDKPLEDRFACASASF